MNFKKLSFYFRIFYFYPVLREDAMEPMPSVTYVTGFIKKSQNKT